MELPPNIILEILLQSDYKDIINLCSKFPNFYHICKDPYFWARKAEMDFGILPQDLILLPGNNKNRYEYIRTVDPQSGLIMASRIGSLALVKLFIAHGADNFSQAMVEGAQNGHIRIVKYLLDLGANLYNFAALLAAENGYFDIVKLLVEVGANNFDEVLLVAAAKGYSDIAKLMLEKGAKDYYRAMYAARSKRHPEIVNLIKSFIS